MSSIDFKKLANEKYVYLTTIGRKTGNPHTVELWFSIVKEKIYLSHEGKYTDWMKNINKDNVVEFRIGDTPFKGRARIIKNGEVFEIGKKTLYFKYYGKASEDIIDDWFSESAVIEISLIKNEL